MNDLSLVLGTIDKLPAQVDTTAGPELIEGRLALWLAEVAADAALAALHATHEPPDEPRPE